MSKFLSRTHEVHIVINKPNSRILREKLRKPRVECIKAYSKWNTELFLGEPAAEARYEEEKSDVKSLKDTKPNMHAKFHSARFIKWILDFDPVNGARKHVEHAAGARL